MFAPVTDIIRLLPDAIANQIAAGEVIQRPASAVKEMMENAIDAGATSIKVYVKQAGKALVQVTDNGSGMSEADARMCFEKHATSKIQTGEDLFAIRTMGFRGEALASIAAIAQVEMKTRLHDQPLGTHIEIESMKVLRHEPCQCPTGTTISVKNLFYNVPARRNFLKSDNVEMKNIVEEFQRLALANPHIAFSLVNNDNEMLHLKPGNLRQRIVALFGDDYAERLVPVEENTYSCSVNGFVGKPSYTKKVRGEQFIFVNKRFIRSAYINHAITAAYDQMIAKDQFPFYCIFIEIEPSRIDVNVHPAKYEVKFEDEKLVYTFVNLGVKHALGAYSVTPSIDFNQEDHLTQNKTFDQPPAWLQSSFGQKESGNTVASASNFRSLPRPTPLDKVNTRNIEMIFQTLQTPAEETEQQSAIFSSTAAHETATPHQLHRRFIVNQIKSGIILIDQQAAHERILFERFVKQLEANRSASQRQLFPLTIALNAEDAQLMCEIRGDVNALGFDIQEFGGNSFIVHSFPADVEAGNEKQVIEELIQQYRDSMHISKLSRREHLARALAFSSSVKAGRALSVDEMKLMIDQLFACENPYTTPGGRKTFITLGLDELERRLEK